MPRQNPLAVQAIGNPHVSYYELDALFGHDTFLLDVHTITAAVTCTTCSVCMDLGTGAWAFLCAHCVPIPPCVSHR